MARALGPVILASIADSFTDGCRISAIVWEGSTTSGDTVVLRHRITNDVLWRGRTDSTQTYQGVNLGPHGEHCPNGFYVSQISAGSVLVYIAQA
jgi:ribosomal protein L19